MTNKNDIDASYKAAGIHVEDDEGSVGISLPLSYTHKVSTEETAQGIRINVTVYGNSRSYVINEAFDTYQESVAEADKRNILRAPMEIKKPKEEVKPDGRKPTFKDEVKKK